MCCIKEVRIMEERHDKIKATMEELMSKFDEMISRQGVLSRKENEVEMPSIKATVNDENMGDNSKEKKDDDDVVDYDRESQMQQNPLYES
jgi:16S rRNA U516 pseudouridylate synthase RsuA-like enzyme